MYLKGVKTNSHKFFPIF